MPPEPYAPAAHGVISVVLGTCIVADVREPGLEGLKFILTQVSLSGGHAPKEINDRLGIRAGIPRISESVLTIAGVR